MEYAPEGVVDVWVTHKLATRVYFTTQIQYIWGPNYLIHYTLSHN